MKKIGLIILGLFLLFFVYVSVDANKYQALVRVVAGESTAGVNPTDLALDFGDLSRGLTAVRRVTIKNDTGLRLYIATVKTGELRQLMSLDHNYFWLEPHASTTLQFSVYVPASATVEHVYKGRVYLFKLPLP